MFLHTNDNVIIRGEWLIISIYNMREMKLKIVHHHIAMWTSLYAKSIVVAQPQSGEGITFIFIFELPYFTGYQEILK